MKNENMPFEIPAIDNRKGALALHLGASDWDSIKEVKICNLSDEEKLVVKSASVFEFQEARYYVDHIGSGMESDCVIAFNSNHWTIKKAPASAMAGGINTPTPWSIKDPAQLPATIRMREAHCYPYLTNGFLSLWLEALRVAHLLLDRHEAKNGDETYYQDNFSADYIAALADPQFGTDEIMFDGVTDPAMLHLHRNDQPAWQAFKDAQEALKTAPRGAIVLLNDQGRWNIRVHAGEGYVCHCRTMRSSGPKPTAREIHECLLSSEAYSARCQAREEKIVLANFARLRDLDLQVGMTIRNVRVLYKGKFRDVNFKVRSISQAGHVDLFDGTLRGSGQRLAVWEPACKILPSQVQAAEPKKVARLVDLETASLI